MIGGTDKNRREKTSSTTWLWLDTQVVFTPGVGYYYNHAIIL